MANNCCVIPAAPTQLSGTVLEAPVIRGGVTMDATTATTVTDTVINTATSNQETRNTLANALVTPILAHSEVRHTIEAKTKEVALSEEVQSAVEARVVGNEAFIKTIISRITNDQAFVQGIADKVSSFLLDDDAALEDLKRCVIASLNRCDGTPLAVGDSVAT